MSVITKSQYVYSERKNNVYKPQDTINFYLPGDTLPLINTKNTYLVFNLKMTGLQYKAAVSQKAGIYSLFRSITISTGDGATVLETLDNYAFLQALKYYYEKTETKENLAVLHEGKPNKMYIDDSSCNQYLDATKFNSGYNPAAPNSNHLDVYKQLELVVPLYLSGLLYRDSVLPNIALKGLRVKIELNPIETIMQVVTAPLYELDEGQNALVSVDGGGYTASTGYAAYGNNADGQTALNLKNANDLVTGNNQRVLSPAVDNPTHLFQIGQYLLVDGHNENYRITNVSVNNQRIILTLDQNLSAAVADDASVSIRTDTQWNDMSLEMSSVRFNVSVVMPPKGYLEGVVKQINAGKMNFDIVTYTDYARNVSTGSLSNRVPLNARNKRCKSLITIPEATSMDSITNDSFQPALKTGDNSTLAPSQYQYFLYNGILVPDRPVSLNRVVAGNYDAVWLRELMLGLKAGNIDVNTVRDAYSHFALARRLSLPGYSYDAMGEMSMQLDFKTLGESLLLHNYVIHLRQIKCKIDGIAVVY